MLGIDYEQLPTFVRVSAPNQGIPFYDQNPNTKPVHTSRIAPIQKYPMYLGQLLLLVVSPVAWGSYIVEY